MATNYNLIGNIPGYSDVLAGVQAVQQQQDRQQLLQQRSQALALQNQKIQQEQSALATRRQIGSQVGAGDLAGARKAAAESGDFELISTIDKLDKDQRDKVLARTAAAAPVLQSAAALPYEQRRAVIAAAAPSLVANGWSEQEIASFDPTDQAISGLVSTTRKVEDIIKQRQDERDFTYKQQNDQANRNVTLRGQDLSHADSAASRAVTIRGQNLTDARSRQSNAINAAGIGKGQMKAEGDLRKEFNQLPEIKDFKDVRSSWNQVRDLGNKKNATAQDDIALIYSYMKMLDPGSVVREGEFATAQNAAGIPDQIRNLYNRAQSGNRLNDRQRRNTVLSAERVYLSRRQGYNSKAREYRSYAQDYGADPNRVADTYVDTKSKSGGGQQMGGGFVYKGTR